MTAIATNNLSSFFNTNFVKKRISLMYDELKDIDFKEAKNEWVKQLSSLVSELTTDIDFLLKETRLIDNKRLEDGVFHPLPEWCNDIEQVSISYMTRLGNQKKICAISNSSGSDFDFKTTLIQLNMVMDSHRLTCISNLTKDKELLELVIRSL